jgi:DsbC/DsbD-like thiol-disulfide interchange protein
MVARMTKVLTLLHTALLAILALTAPMVARAGPADDVARIEVLPGWQTPSGTQMAGLRLTLAPGWKTYWRAPGDGGIPPAFGWAGSQNIASTQFHWPTPEVIDQNGMRSFGYHGLVVIPVEVTPTTPGAATPLQGEVEIGVCLDICVPVRLQFAADLPPDTHRDVAIATALFDNPIPGAEAGLTRVTCTVEPGEGSIWVTAIMDLPATGEPEVVVIEAGDPQVWVSEPQVSRHAGTLSARAEMVHVTGQSFALNRAAVRITVLGHDRAVDIQGCAAD